MKISNETKIALDGSIKHWEENLKEALTHFNEKFEIDTSSKSCPLCVRFNHSCCVECPIFMATGNTNCNGTPYDTVCFLNTKHKKIDGEMIDACQSMLTFLKDIKSKCNTDTETERSPEVGDVWIDNDGDKELVIEVEVNKKIFFCIHHSHFGLKTTYSSEYSTMNNKLITFIKHFDSIKDALNFIKIK
jgi:mRNA deadenylase 3'-5' endonuclease subunit Ccr4